MSDRLVLHDFTEEQAGALDADQPAGEFFAARRIENARPGSSSYKHLTLPPNRHRSICVST